MSVTFVNKTISNKPFSLLRHPRVMRGMVAGSKINIVGSTPEYVIDDGDVKLYLTDFAGILSIMVLHVKSNSTVINILDYPAQMDDRKWTLRQTADGKKIIDAEDV